ncbi:MULTISPECIES: cysteine desulfurase family protein [Gordonia]|uniref:Cysteine desulfurase family protein n=1 Tax=Gordonia amicalis TaxID=89053 RepID=A0AAE4R4K4_9ACTN|nr:MULTISPECIES: cysteine desulfurase family protein [Gordonia]ATD71607.1 cysteine desulfurase [Gordonia sp. 1D]MCZ4581138.1 cysteine desulfurase family protein [Gordonia amicalis]MDJ0454807.1 cysteine desulfurase family protein [Gordonia amicalis]MDV6309307.1 cysteine desulfurase family protein [Gordonia amicalis]MDV6311887.1 cysteine desulfurase family protein [Gordonia amicalis]
MPLPTRVPPRTSVYLDHAASTQMLPEAVEAMTAVFSTPGNASSLHGSGRTARRRLEEAREAIAAAVGARPSEVIFTGGGTESDNLAVKGIYWARRRADEQRRRIIVSGVEHHAVLDPAQWLAADAGAELVVLPVDADGVVSPADLRAELEAHADQTALISVMWANNEVGSIQPIAEIVALGAEFGVPVHSDAVQAVGHLPIDFTASGLSALSLAAHKFGGPQGVGALLLGREVACVPLQHGGGHERDVRSGTQDVAGAAGMAAALTWCVEHMEENTTRVRALASRLTDVLLGVEGTVRNGADVDARLPGNVHVSFAGCEGDSLLMLLDAKGIECSTGSACTAGVAQASHVLLAMGLDMADARSSLRFSLSHTTTDADIDAVAQVIDEVVDRARAAGLVSAPGGKVS